MGRKFVIVKLLGSFFENSTSCPHFRASFSTAKVVH
jgi:hypothetical protein